MPDDLTRKLVDTIQKMQHQINRLLSGRWLENASVRSGRLRFIGGLLRLDSGALLELFGQWRFTGPGAISGDVFSEGKWTQVGDYDFTGDGDLAGSVELSGIFNLIGKLTAGNVRIEDGKIYVGVGGNQIVIDGATGEIRTGDVKVKDGRIEISGPDGILTLNQSRLTLPNGGTVTGTANGVLIQIGQTQFRLSGTQAWVTASNRSMIISDTGIRFTNLPTVPQSTRPGSFVGVVVSDTNGNFSRVVAG